MFPTSISPALKSHLQAQLDFAADLSRKLVDTAQQVSELNLRAVQEMLEEFNQTHQQMLAARDPSEFFSLALNQMQPAGKLQRYQQQLSHLVANAHVEMNRTAETHLPETSRTAAAFADEVVRKTAEETEKATQRQRDLIEKMHAGVVADGVSHQDAGRDAGKRDYPTH
ncbi:phasin family protein [Janthinobacterium sp. Mn2066]|uniref:phasin family protein n=1 Tax=Janthinobacterium sp. Mn2066 TaxID=3395264 RepID=UPI003BBC0F94